jgi:hypothetical protein
VLNLGIKVQKAVKMCKSMADGVAHVVTGGYKDLNGKAHSYY